MSKFAKLDALMAKATKLTTTVKDVDPDTENTYSARMEGVPTSYTPAGLADLAAMRGCKSVKSGEVNGRKVQSRGEHVGGKAADWVNLILMDDASEPPADGKKRRTAASVEANGTAS